MKETRGTGHVYDEDENWLTSYHYVLREHSDEVTREVEMEIFADPTANTPLPLSDVATHVLMKEIQTLSAIPDGFTEQKIRITIEE